MDMSDDVMITDGVRAIMSLTMGIRCPICLDTFRSPVRSACGHNFCKMCLDRHMKLNMDENASSQSPGARKEKLCPLCKKTINKRRYQLTF